MRGNPVRPNHAAVLGCQIRTTRHRVPLAKLAQIAFVASACVLPACRSSQPAYPPAPSASEYPNLGQSGILWESKLRIRVVGARVPPQGQAGLYVDLLVEGPACERYSQLLAGAVQESPDPYFSVTDADAGLAFLVSAPQIRYRDTPVGRRDNRPLFATAPIVERSMFAGPFLDVNGTTSGVRRVILATHAPVSPGTQLHIGLLGDWGVLPDERELTDWNLPRPEVQIDSPARVIATPLQQ